MLTNACSLLVSYKLYIICNLFFMNAFSQHYLAQFNIKPSRHIFNCFGIPAYDDGEGTVYFCCEVPITKSGHLIEVGKSYKTNDFDRLTVTKIELDTRYVKHEWKITGVDDETGDEEDCLWVYEFRKLLS